jgi:cell division protein FtsZ
LVQPDPSEPQADLASDNLKWDLQAPQKELFPAADEAPLAEVPTSEAQADLPQATLGHEEASLDSENVDTSPKLEDTFETASDEGFVIYNLDEVPEPEDLTPDTPSDDASADATPQESDWTEEQENLTPQPQPSVQPSKEAFAERQRQITRNLADFKSKLNLPGRIADLENEPAYKRRNVSIEDTPHSSDSSMSRFSLHEEVDAEGNRRTELRDDNSFLHDNVD